MEKMNFAQPPTPPTLDLGLRSNQFISLADLNP
jgi:hypothetical protein